MNETMTIAPEHDDKPPIWTTHYNHPTQWDQFFAPMAMPDMFVRSAGRKGSAPLIDFMGRKYSYTETASGVCRVARGLQDLAVRHCLPVGYGILTCETRDQAWDRAAVDRRDKGGDAAKACLQMVAIKRLVGLLPA